MTPDPVPVERTLLAELIHLARRGVRCELDADTVAEAQRIARRHATDPTDHR